MAFTRHSAKCCENAKMIREPDKPGKTENTERSALDVRMRGSAGVGGGKQVGGV